MWFWIILTIGLLLGFLIILIMSIYLKKKSLALIALIPLGLAMITGPVSLYLIFRTTYNNISGRVGTSFGPRNGDEIYTDLFGNSAYNCSRVINSQDHIIHILDCCIWLEFSTCPEEAARLIAQKAFEYEEKVHKHRIGYLTPENGKKPDWFEPHTLGDSVLFYKRFNKRKDYQILFFLSSDSTRAFYCDLKF